MKANKTMTPEALSTNPLYVELADKLRADILSGVYAPGDRMPSEPTLCQTTGHSRSTVRKALQEGDMDTFRRLVPETTAAWFESDEAAPVLQSIRNAGNVIHY